MNAQELIDSAKPVNDHLSLFYPEVAKQRQADLNITKCLKEVK